MGSYYGVARFENALHDCRSVLTWREYTAIFREASCSVAALPDDAQSGRSGEMSSPRRTVIEWLMCRVRQCPTDATAHRLLGAALLGSGGDGAGVRHLGIALRLLLADLDERASLYDVLCTRLDIAWLLVPLVSVAARSGRTQLVRRLMSFL